MSGLSIKTIQIFLKNEIDEVAIGVGTRHLLAIVTTSADMTGRQEEILVK